MLPCAYILKEGVEKCKQCGKNHYYLTNNHIVITGSKEELKEINLLNLDIEMYDPTKSDIKKAQNIFGMWPELDTSKKGILRNIGQLMPAMCYGYWIRTIDLSDDKNSIIIKYSKEEVVVEK